MKASVWFNLTRKGYEATLVGRGRPIRQDASEADREASKRVIAFAPTKEGALRKLARLHEVKPSDLEVVKTEMVYKGRREHPYTRREQPVAA